MAKKFYSFAHIRREEKQQESWVTKVDIENLEKEISIDIAELRKDLRGLCKDLLFTNDSIHASESKRKFSDGVFEDGGSYSGKAYYSEKSFISETSVPEEDEAWDQKL